MPARPKEPDDHPDPQHAAPAGVGGTASLRGVAWTGALFVAVGDLGAIFTSPDGSGWTARVTGTGAGLAGVAWSGASLVAVGEGGALLVSP
jgi:hypothetical protein